MKFEDPIDFNAALEELRSRDIVPTALSSAEIRDQWSADLKQRSIFSARTVKAEILQNYEEVLEDIINGKINLAKGRELMEQAFDSLGYDSERGHFATEEESDIPPAERGSLRDLASESRINLVLETNLASIANFGYYTQAMEPDALYSWPCFELVRVAWRRVPRGMRLAKGAMVPDPGKDWPSRWEACGGQFYGDGRMIARKDDPIWAMLGDPSLFDDGLAQPFPPFAFNSGYGTRQVSRHEAIDLGVIREKDRVQPVGWPMNKDVSASAEDFEPEILDAVIQGLKAEVVDRRIILKSELEKAAKAYAINNRELAADFLTNVFHEEYWQRRGGRFAAYLGPDKGGAFGGGAGGALPPLDADTPLTPDDAARLMLKYPEHPVTKAFTNYFKKGNRGDFRAGRQTH